VKEGSLGDFQNWSNYELVVVQDGLHRENRIIDKCGDWVLISPNGGVVKI